MTDEEKYLNNLVADIDCMLPLYEYYDPLNIFNVLELQRNEIRHSNMLYWLLSPHKQHGFGDKFLKKFIIETVKEQDDCEVRPIDIDLMDFDEVVVCKEYPTDTFVKKEKGRIDLFVVSKENNLILAIENKIDTGEHDNQLQRYRKYLEDNYKGYKFVLVYLTPNKDESIDDKENWISVGYQTIYEVLLKLISNCQINDKAKIYIQDYMELIRRNIMNEKEDLKKTCEGIYFQHQEAFDIIYDYIKQIKEQDVLADAIYDILYSKQTEWGYVFRSRGPTGTMFFNFNGHEELTVRVDRYEKEWKIRVVIGYGDPENDKKKEAFNKFSNKIKGDKVLGLGEIQLHSKKLISRDIVEKKQKPDDNLKNEITSKLQSWYNEVWKKDFE